MSEVAWAYCNQLSPIFSWHPSSPLPCVVFSSIVLALPDQPPALHCLLKVEGDVAWTGGLRFDERCQIFLSKLSPLILDKFELNQGYQVIQLSYVFLIGLLNLVWKQKMQINFHPGFGKILYCDFSHQVEPEMIKKRPVVVVSRKNGNLQLCTVVPLSGTEPSPVRPWHHKLDRSKLHKTMQGNDWWAKCDCIASVHFGRLSRVKEGKDPYTGKRKYVAPTLYHKDLESIQRAILSHLGLSALISGDS